MNKVFPLEPIEKASIDELRALQLQRLRSSLMHAYTHSPVYRAKFDAAGVHPADCRHLSDLSKFPFTTKADLRDSYPFGMFAVPREQLARIHASSGTTGKPTVVGYTLNDIDTWSQCVARSIRAAGARPGDTVHISYGYGLFTGGLGAHYGAEKLGLTVVPFGGGQTERQVQLIHDFKPDIIMVTPSYMLALADEFERQGIPNVLRPRTAPRYGKTIFTRRSSIPTPVNLLLKGSGVNWCSPVSPKKPCPSSVTERVTSPVYCPALLAPCGALKKSRAAVTT